MTDYLENIKDEEHHLNSIGYRDDMGTPLLSENEYTNPIIQSQSKLCLITQQGFEQNSSNDKQNSSKAQKQLILAILLCFIFMIAEIIGGYFAGSLAIMADAAHLLSDCVSFIVALLAIWLSRKPPDNRMTFGYKRAEVLGAILSIIGIWILTTFLCYISMNRLIYNDFDIDAKTMIIISGIGIIINVVMAFILHGSCNMPHTHSHGGSGGGHSHGHSHHIKKKLKGNHRHNSQNQQHHLHNHHHHQNENDDNVFEINNTVNNTAPTFIINGNSLNDRSDSICSYRPSPNHSRTNSFSKNLPINSATDFSHSNGLNRHNSLSGGGGGGGLVTIRLGDNSESDSNRYHQRRSSSVDSIGELTHYDNENHQCSSKNNDADKTNLNIRAAVIHVVGDIIQSIGVFIAAVVINFYPTAKIVDPLCTFLFSIIVMFTTIRIMKESIIVILDAVPPSVDIKRLKLELECVPGVRSCHHLNVWSVTIDWNVMSAHLIIDSNSNTNKILDCATEMVQQDFGIKHCTIQLERYHHTDSEQLTSALQHHNNVLDMAESIINFV